MNIRSALTSVSIRTLWLRAAILFTMTISMPPATAGTWTQLANVPPEEVNTMLLLSDGTVMAAGASADNTWYRLTPDSKGNYANGTWSTLATMNYTRLYYSSDVLTNGTVFVAGGEYGSGGNTAEIYDPIANIWTTTPAPTDGEAQFLDAISEILPNGNVLVAPATGGATQIYVTASNLWTVGPFCVNNADQNEASWVKLPDDSILTVDLFSTASERYIPSLNQWIRDGNVPVQLWSSSGEIGPAFLLPDGRAFFLGATGNTALYTPSGGTNQGSWQAGPVFPGSEGASDAPGAMMVDGHVFCAVTSGSQSSFYEYDPVANAFTLVMTPSGGTVWGNSTTPLRMLDLPDGTVLFSSGGYILYQYRPSGAPLAAGKPAISNSNMVHNADGSFHLTGTGFNGISEGAAYGDDAQMASNFPLVRMTNMSNGNVYYARTLNWNSTSVMTGNRLVGTDFVLPTGLPTADYSLVVVANGISSDPITFPTAASPPIINVQPKSQTLPAGTNVTFTIAAAGSSLNYSWNRNGSSISGATNTSYSITNVQVANSGAVFTCVVSNFNGATVSSNGVLTVNPDYPVITMQPTNITVVAGSNATFTIAATSVAPRSYFWQRNGSFIAGATDTTYTLTNAQTTDSGSQFSCLVSNMTGTMLSSNAVLTVVQTPANDQCSGAFVITNYPYTNSQLNTYATSTGDPIPPCTMNGFGRGLWYEFTAPSDGEMLVDTAGSSFKAAFEVLSGSCGSFTEVNCNDSATGLSTAASNSVTAGVSYYILVGGYKAGTLDFYFNFTPAVGPTMKVQPLSSTNFLFSFPTVTGRNYVVEYKDQLSDENWIPFQTNAGNGGTATVTNQVSASPQRFFRLRLQ